MTDEQEIDPQIYSAGLKKVRQRRWFLWLVILIYIPAMMLALESPDAGSVAVKVFIAWIIVLCVAVGLACVVRCPRCGGSFHTHGPTFIPFRRCVHCCLHVNADKTEKKLSKSADH
ncbi:MAG TPA: hypothetical protein VIR78_07460 [Malonomonas sp.]